MMSGGRPACRTERFPGLVRADDKEIGICVAPPQNLRSARKSSTRRRDPGRAGHGRDGYIDCNHIGADSPGKLTARGFVYGGCRHGLVAPRRGTGFRSLPQTPNSHTMGCWARSKAVAPAQPGNAFALGREGDRSFDDKTLCSASAAEDGTTCSPTISHPARIYMSRPGVHSLTQYRPTSAAPGRTLLGGWPSGRESPTSKEGTHDERSEPEARHRGGNAARLQNFSAAGAHEVILR